MSEKKEPTAEEKAREKGYKLGYEAGYKAGEKEEFQKGQNQAYPIGYSKGRLEGKKDIVTSIETMMAKVNGYRDRQKWALEGQIPSWWIAVLIDNWEPAMREPQVLREVKEGEVVEPLQEEKL